MEEKMCTREEVERVVDRSSSEIHKHINRFEETRDRDMKIIAKAEVTSSVTKVVQWIGVGGFIAIISFIWFFSGLNSDVNHLSGEMSSVSDSIEEVTSFMNRGDRFTIEDGNGLKSYVDQQDEFVQRQVDTLSAGQTSIKDTLDEIKDLIRN